MSLKTWFTNNVLEKLNPAQSQIALQEGSNIYAENNYNYTKAYDNLPVVRRGVDLIANGCAAFDVDIRDKLSGVLPIAPSIRKAKLNNLLNYQPNPYVDMSKFRRLIYLDILLEGNAFLYYDGVYLYNLPSANVEILTDSTTYVKGYKYNSTVTFKPEEIIHIADGSSNSIYRGTSRLKAISEVLTTRYNMTAFQSSFFKNGAVVGLVLKSPNVLGDKIKQRMRDSWQAEYSPSKSARRPMILDGGLELDNIADINFKELDFADSIIAKDREILIALGVPEVLITSGNNANLNPNLRLLYAETIVPLVRMVNSALERFFGYDIEHEGSKVYALQPELREEAGYHSTLVNGGVLTANEARTALRYPTIEGHDELRIPANIAGSAAGDPAGGRPSNGTE